MKRTIFTLLFAMMITGVQAQSTETFHDFTAITILGDTISLSQYAGKKVLVVNTASYCGYTPQFNDLQALDSIYSSYNFEVVGFPCNDFGGQDPGEDSVILGFCTGTYGVTFQMMSKISITAPDTAEVYKWLQLQSRNGVANAPVTWNFNKYCIDENGQWVMHFPQTTLPFDTAITNWITGGTTVGYLKNNDEGNIRVVNPVKDKLTIQTYFKNVAAGKIELYDVDGCLLSKLFDGRLNSGDELSFETGYLAAGIYVVNFSFTDFSRSIKVAIVK